MKPIHVILSTIAVGVVVLATALVSYSEAEEPADARFIDVSFLGKGEMIDDKTVIRQGQFATITLDVEKLSAPPIDEILIKTHFSNSNNGKILIVSDSFMYPSVDIDEYDYVDYLDAKNVNPFQENDKTGVMMLTISTINAPASPLEDTVNVVLYADGVEMDRLAFDIIAKN